MTPHRTPGNELFLYRVEIQTLASKSATQIGNFELSTIVVTCWATDARHAIAQAEAEAASQHVTVDRIKNVVDCEMPMAAHIDLKSDKLVTN